MDSTRSSQLWEISFWEWRMELWHPPLGDLQLRVCPHPWLKVFIICACPRAHDVSSLPFLLNCPVSLSFLSFLYHAWTTTTNGKLVEEGKTKYKNQLKIPFHHPPAINFSSDLFNITPNAQAKQNWTSSKVKTCIHQRTLSRKWKDNLQDKIFVYTYLISV